MLFLLSPAKTLDYETPVPTEVLSLATAPLYPERAAELIGVLRKKSPKQIARLMDLSENLAVLNAERYAAWQPQDTPANAKPAALAFDGDVYEGLQAKTLQAADLAWAQEHLVILSGLYGVLRPLDLLQPYRLEMGTALKTRRAKTLYGYWGDTLAEHLNQLQAGEAEPIVVNLASVEYARAALRPSLRARVVDCVFEDWKGGGYKVISFFAKKARGSLARHAVLQRATRLSQIENFAADGYALDRAASASNKLVFRRRA